MSRALDRLRYDQGMEASLQLDYPQAVTWFERLLPDAHILGRKKANHAILYLAQAHKQLENWERAAEVFLLLAGPDCDVAYLALYELGDCYLEAGRYEEALDALTEYVERFPQSGLLADAEYRISLAQSMLKHQAPPQSQSAPASKEVSTP